MCIDDMNKLVESAIKVNQERHFGNVHFDGMIRTLEDRINQAQDEGLKGVVFWRQWLNYAQATECLSILKKEQIKADQIKQEPDCGLQGCNLQDCDFQDRDLQSCDFQM